MARPLVECIPNFSEGRNTAVIDAVVQSIRAIRSIRVLDVHSDPDHNRSVVTFVGSPDAVVDAAFAAIFTASSLIDMDVHQGQHPRIGGTDVMPFVPIRGVTMDDCVNLARALGQRVGSELGIPVYLYEAAATRPDRLNLADIRRGEYEGLKAAIATDPNRTPDFGPSVVGKAGAVVIGARAPLIAYNVYLTTDDVTIAKKIAETVRHSSGGLPYVKALGLLVGNRAQVSMNLTDYTQTSVADAVEAIRREAARYEVSIHHSELVGLIPQAALVDAARQYLQLDPFTSDQILENRLFDTPNESTFLDRLAAGTPAPGGGAAAAYAGAMAAALAAMVARVTLGKKKYADVQARMEAIALEADQVRGVLTDAVMLDVQAVESVMTAMKLPRDTSAEQTLREAAIEKASLHAFEMPLDVVRHSVRALELLAEAAEIGNVNGVADAAAGASMARAAVQAAALNAKVNAASIADQEAAHRSLETLGQLENRAGELHERIQRAVHERVN